MIRKHSITLHGHRTSLSLEDAFWDELRVIAAERAISLAALIAEIDDARGGAGNLSSALRLHVLDWVKSRDRSADGKALFTIRAQDHAIGDEI